MLSIRSIILGSLLVWQIGCGGSTRPPSTSPMTPSPNISISPATAIVGSSDFTLTITGSKTFLFAGGGPRFNKVIWSVNGHQTELSASFVSSSQLIAKVPATLLSSPLQAQLHVEIWDRQEGSLFAMSSSIPFSVTTAATAPPSITSISPESVPAGSPDVTLTITGSNFDHTGHLHVSVAFWTTDPNNLHDHGIALNTTVVSSSQLNAVIPAALLQDPASVQIVVLTGDPMGMSDGFFGYPKSNSVAFTVIQDQSGCFTMERKGPCCHLVQHSPEREQIVLASSSLPLAWSGDI